MKPNLMPSHMRLSAIAISSALVATLSFAASKTSNEHKRLEEYSGFSDWRNKPHEPFSDGAKTFERVKKMLLEQYYNSKITEEDLYRAAVQGMLNNLDPENSAWNRLLTPGEVKEVMTDTSGKVVGIGIEVGFNDNNGLIDILDVIKDSPAEKAGLKRGNTILKIDGKSFNGKQLRDVVYAMRGVPGTNVNVSVLDEDRIRTVTVNRVSLSWETVITEMLPNGIALLTINYFTEQTPSLIKQSLTKLANQTTNGLIVDLRGNEGGLLESAINSLDQLVPKGAIIVKVLKRGGKQEDVIAKNGTLLSKVPVTVLVNAKTKSSAEIAAGSLQQNNGAIIIGQKTFGKWSSQRLEDLSNKYAVKFTTMMFLAPNSQNYSGVGISPDITVDSDSEVIENLRHERNVSVRLTKDVQLQTAFNYLKKRP